MDLEDEAEQAEENGDLKTACALRKEIAAKSQSAASFFSYGLLATRLEQWEDAEDAFASALHLDPSFSPGMEGMGILWHKRTDRGEAESFQIARDWYLKAIKLDSNARALTLLGCAYVALGDSTAAQTAFEDALKLDPRYEEALYNLARRQEESNPARARELLEKAIEIDADYFLAHQRLGILRQRSGDLIRAEYHFRRSLETDPTHYGPTCILLIV